MSLNLTAELMADPELFRIAHQARMEVFAEAESRGRRFTIAEVADRMAVLGDWRHRALVAEAQIERLSSPLPGKGL